MIMYEEAILGDIKLKKIKKTYIYILGEGI